MEFKICARNKIQEHFHSNNSIGCRFKQFLDKSTRSYSPETNCPEIFQIVPEVTFLNAFKPSIRKYTPTIPNTLSLKGPKTSQI